MSLKQLRIAKGLNQRECAEYLGMSLRNYQNYENDKNKSDNDRYQVIYRKLEEYGKTLLKDSVLSNSEYNTHVIVGEGVVSLVKTVSKYKKRNCFALLEKFIKGEYTGKVCVLYGLRRTGKTTMLFQMMGDLPVEKTAYIKIQTSDDMSKLTKDLGNLWNKGYRYVFIDEITLMDDFVNTAAVLSDVYGVMGMKIVVSGTDSLGFFMANRDELYDRSCMIHTSFISFKEYCRLMDINSIDSYIEYGGTLKMENMGFDDPDSIIDEVSFRDDESTRKYIDTSISRNIQHTLKNDRNGEYFNQLRELFLKGELTNVINRVVESVNHQFLLQIVTEKFKSHDLGSSRQLLLHDLPNKSASVLYDVDEEKVIELLKKIIDVKEKEETTIEITQEHVDKIKNYLIKLDLLVDCSERYESGGRASIYIISQPGMRYSISKALVYSLMQDEYFKSISESDKQYIIDKILNDVKGRMLEDIVLLEKSKTCLSNEEVFKFKFDNGGEYDMVIYDRNSNTCRIYEIKHSDKIVEMQYRHLKDDEKCKLIQSLFGEIKGKYVLYRGESKLVDNIQYLNVENFLCE